MIEGFDASAYQGPIDFSKVKPTGKAFCYLKATEGLTVTDSQFAHNWPSAERAGIPCGAYHFFHPRVDAALQAERFLSAMKGMVRPLIPCVDIESTMTTRQPDEWPAFQSHQIVELIMNFSDVVNKELGVLPLLYIRPQWMVQNILVVDRQPLSVFKLWVPYWSSDINLLKKVYPTAWLDNWVLWQYSATGRVNGILNDTGDVDLDRSLVDITQITLN